MAIQTKNIVNILIMMRTIFKSKRNLTHTSSNDEIIEVFSPKQFNMKSCVLLFQNYSINNEISSSNLLRLQKDLGFTSDPTIDVKKNYLSIF
jgi:hypothetical protein